MINSLDVCTSRKIFTELFFLFAYLPSGWSVKVRLLAVLPWAMSKNQLKFDAISFQLYLSIYTGRGIINDPLNATKCNLGEMVLEEGERGDMALEEVYHTHRKTFISILVNS